MGNSCRIFKFGKASDESDSVALEDRTPREPEPSLKAEEQQTPSSDVVADENEASSTGANSAGDNKSDFSASKSETESRYLERRFSQFELIKEVKVEGPANKEEKRAARPRNENVKKFLNQDIDKIRRQKGPFKDTKFPANMKAINKSPPGKIEQSLCSYFRLSGNSQSQLESKIKWERTKCIAYHNQNNLQQNNEFVVDSYGKPIIAGKNEPGSLDLKQYFSAYDIFQNRLGDCYFLAALMGVTNNTDLMNFIVPIDNGYRNNMKVCAYHFRFWQMGQWYDVVVGPKFLQDDYLPVDSSHQPIFTHNMTYPNEFWICLLEKAFAKFIGDYNKLVGGFFINAAVCLSGGVADVYQTEIVSSLANPNTRLGTHAELIKNIIVGMFPDIKYIYPTPDELFELISLALERKDTVGCHQNQGEIAQTWGIMEMHQYVVTGIGSVKDKGIKYIKVLNPHNKPDELKKKKNYETFEAELQAHNLWTTYPGEFYMHFKDFLKCFQTVIICNLTPDMPPPRQLPPELSKKLSPKTTLLSAWKTHKFNGSIAAKFNGPKTGTRVQITVNTKSKEHIIYAICQTYQRNTDFLKIVLHKFTNNKWTVSKPSLVSFDNGYMQYTIQLELDPGKYLCVIEPFYSNQSRPFKADIKFCSRIFIRKNVESMIQVKLDK